MKNPGTSVVDPSLVDAGKRASDIVNGYRTFVDWEELRYKWVAIRLSDGGHDGTLYDSKADAVKHQLHENLCAYVCFANLVGGSDPYEMAIFLQFNRDAYDSGMRLVDPDSATGGPEALITTGQRDFYKGVINRDLINRVMRRGY